MPTPQVIGKYPKLHHSMVAVLAHLSLIPSAFIERGLLAWLLPLIVWLLFRRISPLVDHHGQHAINWGAWLACVSGVFHGITYLNPGSEKGATVVFGAIAILWMLGVLRRALMAWQGQELRHRRFSWVG